MPQLSALDPALATAAVVLSVAMSVAGLILGPIVIARLPADYFVRPRHHPAVGARSAHSFGRGALFALRTVLGAVLVLAGIAMLVLPGQGVLTIIAGLSLLHFPGKRALQRRLLSLPGLHALCQLIRARAGKPPLQL